MTQNQSHTLLIPNLSGIQEEIISLKGFLKELEVTKQCVKFLFDAETISSDSYQEVMESLTEIFVDSIEKLEEHEKTLQEAREKMESTRIHIGDAPKPSSLGDIPSNWLFV